MIVTLALVGHTLIPDVNKDSSVCQSSVLYTCTHYSFIDISYTHAVTLTCTDLAIKITTKRASIKVTAFTEEI